MATELTDEQSAIREMAKSSNAYSSVSEPPSVYGYEVTSIVSCGTQP